MSIYADTNFFTNSLLELPFSPHAERLMVNLCGSGEVLPVPLLVKLEVTSALQRLVGGPGHHHAALQPQHDAHWEQHLNSP